MLFYISGPVQEIFDPMAEAKGIRMFIKREDLNHPFISGNKWWKLKYNFEEANRSGKKTILTFGGAYSNHIYATAAAAHELQFQSIGIIRGEEILPLNPTLQFAQEKGMHLQFVSREKYREKTNSDFIHNLKEQFGDFYLIPEGGTNELAVKGCSEFAHYLNTLEFDYACLPVGTGGTMAGLVSGLTKGNVFGFSVLKGGDFLTEEVKKLTKDSSTVKWDIIQDFHFGGYAKTTPVLIQFIKDFEKNHNIPLDQVYTGKMMYGVFDMIRRDLFPIGSNVLIIHTGGLQGKSPD